LDALIGRSRASLDVITEFVNTHDWIDFLVAEPKLRSCTSICLKVTADWFAKLLADQQAAFCKSVTKALESEGVVYDAASYRDAPAGFRLWGGPTVAPADTKIALAWLNWAYETNKPA
jgi:phosphoserine aminotransferase